MLRRTLIVILALGLAACVQPAVTTFQAPNGADVGEARCTGSPKECFKKATESCGGKSYQVIDSYSNAGGLVADIMPGPITWYTMTFQCGRSDGRLPQFPRRGAEYTPAPIVYQPAPRYTYQPPPIQTHRTIRTNCTNYFGNVSCYTN